MARVPPLIDDRNASAYEAEILAIARSYTPGWRAERNDADDPGWALVQAFAYLAESLTTRINRVPNKQLAWFLSTLGVKRLPAVPAEVYLQFRLVPGTADAVRVPPATQTIAPTAVGEIAFETTRELRLFPGQLTDVVGVDPAADAIYMPPPSFLARQPGQPAPAVYGLASFAAAGSTTFQLDHATALESDRGTQLELDGDLTLQVTGVNDTIVSVHPPLSRNFDRGTRVRNLSEFKPFHGFNRQEHILYIAHDEVLNLEGVARITLKQHSQRGSAESIDVVWEYFGDSSGNEGWHPLTVVRDDGRGFRMGGEAEIVLVKGAGEIVPTKLRESDVRELRYIRARVSQPLPASLRTSLAVVDRITLVSASENRVGLLPDAAFHNATPITLPEDPNDENAAFYPFGREPRRLDNFYIASEEAFSKSNATITLETRIDASGALGSPAATQAGDKVRVFAVGRGGHLIELEITATEGAPEERLWIDHGPTPDGRAIESSTVAALTLDVNSMPWVYIFVATAEKVYLRMHNGIEWSWVDVGVPQDEQLAHGVAAAARSASEIVLFSITMNGQLFRRRLDATGVTIGNWTVIPIPQEQVDEAPFAVSDGTNVWAFVHTDQNSAHQYDDIANATAPLTIALKEIATSPFGLIGGNGLEVFLITADGELVDHTNQIDLATGVDTTASAGGVVSNGVRRVFARVPDGRILQVIGTQNPTYIQPGDTGTARSPTALEFLRPDRSTPTFVSIFSSGERNSLLEHRFTYAAVAGVLRAGPLQIMYLDGNSVAQVNDIIEITTGASDHVRTRIQEIVGDVTLLETPLKAPLTTNDRYRVWRFAFEGVMPLDVNTLVNVGPEITQIMIDMNLSFPGPPRPAIWIQLDYDTSPGNLIPSLPDPPIISLPSPHDGSKFRLYVGPEDSETPSRHSRDLVALDDVSSAAANLGIRFPGTSYANAEWRIAIAPIALSGNGGLLDLDGDLAVPYPQAGDPFEVLTGETPTTGSWITQKDPYEQLDPRISWEYWNGSGWDALGVPPTEQAKFLKSARDDALIEFDVPADMALTEVAGTEALWIRARLVDGDYGQETFQLDDEDNLVSSKDEIRAPRLLAMRIRYTLKQNVPPDRCVTFNNLVYRDQTAACNTANTPFQPFEVLEVDRRSLYLGFDQPFQGGPLNVLFDAAEHDIGGDTPPEIDWRFRRGREWIVTPVEDDSEGLTRSAATSFAVDHGISGDTFFGNEQRYWLRGRFEDDQWESASPLLHGLYTNVARAMQAETVTDEIIGSSTGEPDQSFEFVNGPVLNEEVRVLEVLTEEELAELQCEGSAHDVILGGVQRADLEGQWVRWQEASGFFASQPGDRHYVIDRQERSMVFGDGRRGRIPPANVDGVRAFRYQHGGGIRGNVAAGGVQSLASAIAGVESVTNPLAAGGGSDAASSDAMLTIGPRQLSHRDRAITPSDFESLAVEASREVVIARCQRNRNTDGFSEVGNVLVRILPDGRVTQLPEPSLELRRRVQRYLEGRTLATTAGRSAISVQGPVYVPVKATVDLFAVDVEHASAAETNARRLLKDFLHPVTGGWQFGQPLYASDVYQLLVETPHVHHVGAISLEVTGRLPSDRVIVGADDLIAGLDPVINIAVGEG